MFSRRQVLQWFAALAAAGVAAPAYGAVEPLLRPRITRYHLQPKRWPRDLQVTIAVLADIHACRPWMAPERIRLIAALTN